MRPETRLLDYIDEMAPPVTTEEAIARTESPTRSWVRLGSTAKRREGAFMTKTDESAKTQIPVPGRGLAWAVAALAVVLAIGGLYFAFSGGDGQVVVDQTTVPTQTTVSTPTTAPAPEPISGAFVLDLGTGEQTPLARLFDDAYFVSASPDGTRLFANILNDALMANLDGTAERRT